MVSFVSVHLQEQEDANFGDKRLGLPMVSMLHDLNLY